MADVRHRLITEGEKHDPKGFTTAGNYTELIRDENGISRYKKTLVLEEALNFVDGNAVPPTTVAGDVYVIIDEGNGAVNADWDGASYNEWVRFNGTEWVAVAPTEGVICYDATANYYKFYNGTSWGRFIPISENISTTDLTWAANRTQDLNSNELAFTGGLNKFEKVELTSTDNGVLLNRVTTAQMNAIASPTTNEIVYNTELNALYRYDGANWVALSAGYGLVSVNDSSGIPTFYANLKAAYDAATSGIVKLHSNITETSVNTITFKDGVYIDLNGYKYTYNVSDNSSAFNTSGSVTGFKFGLYNGEFSRLNQVGNQYAINIGNNAIVDLSNLNAVSSNNQCLSIGSDTKAFGSKFTSNISGIGNLITSNGILNGGTLINLGTGENRCQGVLNRVSCEAVSSNGIQLIGGKGYYLTCTSTSGDGLRATSGSEVYHSTGISSSGSGVVLGSNTIAEYCTGTSTSGVGFTAVSTSESYYCKGLSSTGIAFYVGAIAEFCTAITNSGTYAYLMDNLGSKLINCIGRVKTGTGSGVDINTANCEVIDCKMFLSSSLAYGLVPGARDTYVNGLKVKGSTLLFNWGGGASRNVWTATSDAQENSAQL